MIEERYIGGKVYKMLNGLMISRSDYRWYDLDKRKYFGDTKRYYIVCNEGDDGFYDVFRSYREAVRFCREISQ